MKFTINDFNEKYPDDDVCLDEIFKARYGSIKLCPKCQKETKFNRIKMRKCYCCEFCGFQLHPVANTIFHKSDTSLRNWFYAIFLFSTSKNGVSAKELERQLGVTYKCAWRIAKQIRLLFEQNREALKNIVEIDETFWGGVSSRLRAKEFKNRGKPFKWSSKKPVLGMVERGGIIKAKVVINTKRKTVLPLIREHIEIGTEIMSDNSQVYRILPEEGYPRQTVNHWRKEWTKGNVHVNTLEGFWSQLKRSLNGTYHMVSPKYLQSYVNEFSYRYNHRSLPSLFGLMIARAVQQV